MRGLSRRIVLAAAAFGLAVGPAVAGVPADAVQGDMSLGNPKARVHVVEYASAACPHCAHFNEAVFPEFRKQYIDTGRVYYTLKEYLTSPPEVAAAGFLLARCGGKAGYFTILDAVFRSQSEWRTGDIGQILVKVGQANGLSEGQINGCLTDEAALQALNARVVAAAEQDKVSSTPTFDVNGTRIEGAAPLSDLGAAIAAAEQAPPRRPPKPRKGR